MTSVEKAIWNQVQTDRETMGSRAGIPTEIKQSPEVRLLVEKIIKEGVGAADVESSGYYEDLVEVVGGLMDAQGGKRRGAPPGPLQDYRPNKQEIERIGAMQEFFEMQMACTPNVRLFRQKLSGGRLLTKRQAWSVLNSPLAELFTFEELREWQLSAVDDVGEVVKKDVVIRVRQRPGPFPPEDAPFIRLTVRVNGGQSERTVEHEWGSKSVLIRDERYGGDFLHTPHVFRNIMPASLFERDLTSKWGVEYNEVWKQYADFPLRLWSDGDIGGYQGTVLWQALQVCGKLNKDYTLDLQTALIWLLTGIHPVTPFVSLMKSNHVPIYKPDGVTMIGTVESSWHMKVENWLDAENLAKFYRTRQQHRRGDGQKRMNRQVKNFRLFRFVNQMLYGKPNDPFPVKHPTWQQVYEQWQKEPHEEGETVPKDYRDMRRLYVSARDSMLGIHGAFKKRPQESQNKNQHTSAEAGPSSGDELEKGLSQLQQMIGRGSEFPW